MKAEIINQRLRFILLLLSTLALLVTLADLWLQNHNQSWVQFIPWALGGAGLTASIANLIWPGKNTVLALRGVMTLLVLGGLTGMVIHLKGNLEFQQEIHPTAALESFWLNAIKGAAPILAPGALIFAALVAILATYQHPALVGQDEESKISQLEREGAEKV